jgi:hypothetical protein
METNWKSLQLTIAMDAHELKITTQNQWTPSTKYPRAFMSCPHQEQLEDI